MSTSCPCRTPIRFGRRQATRSSLTRSSTDARQAGLPALALRHLHTRALLTGRREALPLGQRDEQRADALAMPQLSLSIDLKSRSVSVATRHACLRASEYARGWVNASYAGGNDLFPSVPRSTPRRTSCISSNNRHRDALTWSPCRLNGNSDTPAAWSRVPMIRSVLVRHLSSDLQGCASMRAGGRNGHRAQESRVASICLRQPLASGIEFVYER